MFPWFDCEAGGVGRIVVPTTEVTGWFANDGL